MAEVHDSMHDGRQAVLCLARARGIACNAPPTLPHGNRGDQAIYEDRIEHIQRVTLEKLLFRRNRYDPELRAQIVAENKDDRAIVMALGPGSEPEPETDSDAVMAKPAQAGAARAALAPKPEGPAAEPAAALAESPREDHTMAFVSLGVVLAMGLLAALVVHQGRSRLRNKD